MKKVLIFTAGYGEGHNAAARGLCAGLEQSGAKAEVLDLFAGAYGEFYQKTRKNYLRMIDRTPRIWAAVYGLLDRTPLIHVVAPVLRKLQNEVSRAIEAHSPAAVVSTYPIYNYVLNRISNRRVQAPLKQYTVVTDSISVNSVWFRCDTDAFFVPNEDTAAAMRRSGVPAGKLRVLGFPVPPVFATDRPVRPEPGPGQAPRVLYMINAAKGRAPALVEHLLKLPDLELTVTAGRDEVLMEEIKAVAQRMSKSVEVHGWTPRMPELVMRSHLLIGKAGGAAVQESVAACTPMIITQVVPGQEEGNARLLLENGCGCFAEEPEAIAAAVGKAFADGATQWKLWHENICKLSMPDASLRIAESILKEV